MTPLEPQDLALIHGLLGGIAFLLAILLVIQVASMFILWNKK